MKESHIPADRSPHTDLDWAVRLVEALFAHDGDGRLHARREPRPGHAAPPPCSASARHDSLSPPRFVFVRTRHGNLWRFRTDLAPGTLRELARLAAKEAPLRELELRAAGPPPPERIEAWRRILAAAGDGGQEAGYEQRCWALRPCATAAIVPPEELALLVYEADELFFCLAPHGRKSVLEAAMRSGLVPFAEVFELGG